MPVVDVERLLFVTRTCEACKETMADDRHSVWLAQGLDCQYCHGTETMKTAEDDREDFYVDTDGNRI